MNTEQRDEISLHLASGDSSDRSSILLVMNLSLDKAMSRISLIFWSFFNLDFIQ